VDGGDGEAARAEEGFDARGFFLVEAEGEDAAFGLVGFDDLQHARLLVEGGHDLDFLDDARVGAELARGVVGADGDVYGGGGEGGGEGADGGRPGGGEHEGLAAGGGGGRVREDVADLVFEAGVEHAVGFVEDEVVHGGEVGVAFVNEVVEAAGGGDYDVGGCESGALGVFGDSPVDAGGGEAGRRGEGRKLFVDLDGEFAGGGDDDCSS